MNARFEAFVAGITTCYKSIQRIKASEMTEFGLKGTHLMCLYYLHHNPEGLTAARLCTLCEEDKSAISRTLTELEERGYVAGDRDDGRKKYRVLMRLTELGVQVGEKVDRLVAQWVEAGGGGLSQTERAAFYRALEVISGNLKQGFPNNKK